LLGNDMDAGGDGVLAELQSRPAHGDLVLRPDGGFTYTPKPKFIGTDTFQYRANDGRLSSKAVRVDIRVVAVNAPPVATPDTYSFVEDSEISVGAPGVLANDRDPDGGTLRAELVRAPSDAFEFNP